MPIKKHNYWFTSNFMSKVKGVYSNSLIETWLHKRCYAMILAQKQIDGFVIISCIFNGRPCACHQLTRRQRPCVVAVNIKVSQRETPRRAFWNVADWIRCLVTWSAQAEELRRSWPAYCKRCFRRRVQIPLVSALCLSRRFRERCRLAATDSEPSRGERFTRTVKELF